jgi:hypothetical protein
MIEHMTVQDVYFLCVHEPYESADHPVPINATVVHAETLLHPEIPQPDGGLMYRCLTEFPDRSPGCIVPLSTLTFELDGGRLWEDIGDWERVAEALAALVRNGKCDAMSMGLPQLVALSLSHGPTTDLQVGHPDGSQSRLSPADRKRHLADLTGHLRENLAQGRFWRGDHLTTPPAQPATLPYRPFQSSPPASAPADGGHPRSTKGVRREEAAEQQPGPVARLFRRMVNPGSGS